MTVTICELDVAELDIVGGGIQLGTIARIVLTGAVAAICKSATEAFVGGVAAGLETGGAGFVVAALGGAAAVGCAYGMSQ